MTDASMSEWNKTREELQLRADLFRIDCDRKALRLKIEELDKEERRLLGLR